MSEPLTFVEVPSLDLVLNPRAVSVILYRPSFRQTTIHLRGGETITLQGDQRRTIVEAFEKAARHQAGL